MYLRKTPGLVKPLFRDFLWDVKTDNREVFITFDDGPHESVTTEVLELLEKYKARATFFCVGKQIELFPDTFASTIQRGHTVGSHSYSHPNGWKTPTAKYVQDVLTGANKVPGNLFRPPYGRITRSQSAILKKQFRIVMWSLLTGDFDLKQSAQQCADITIKNARPGSIIVFHDSQKAAPRMIPALQQVLNDLSKQNFTFSGIQ